MLATSPYLRDHSLISSCLTTMAHLIPISASVFYLVNQDMTPDHYVLQGISEKTHQQYLAHFQNLDPLHPMHFEQDDISIVGFNQRELSRYSYYYHDFMLPNGMQDVIEIFIRQRKRIIAGVSLVRDKPFTEAERHRLQAALPLFELATLDMLPEPPASRLTAKEHEIITLVREGASNKRIALRLGISLSTVKTHMRNIFAKTQVLNRTELASSFYVSHS